MRHDRIDPGVVPAREPDPFAPRDLRARTCARDWATGPGVTVRLDAPLAVAQHALGVQRLKEVAVVDFDDRFVGVATEQAIGFALAAAVSAVATYTVSAVVVPSASVSPDSDIRDVAGFMEERGLTSLPVVDAGRVVATVTQADVVEGVRSLPAVAEVYP
jgi:CBS domain-containing protein